jgi:hypothetical protein
VRRQKRRRHRPHVCRSGRPDGRSTSAAFQDRLGDDQVLPGIPTLLNTSDRWAPVRVYDVWGVPGEPLAVHLLLLIMAAGLVEAGAERERGRCSPAGSRQGSRKNSSSCCETVTGSSA